MPTGLLCIVNVCCRSIKCSDNFRYTVVHRSSAGLVLRVVTILPVCIFLFPAHVVTVIPTPSYPPPGYPPSRSLHDPSQPSISYTYSTTITTYVRSSLLSLSLLRSCNVSGSQPSYNHNLHRNLHFPGSPYVPYSRNLASIYYMRAMLLLLVRPSII